MDAKRIMEALARIEARFGEVVEQDIASAGRDRAWRLERVPGPHDRGVLDVRLLRFDDGSGVRYAIQHDLMSGELLITRDEVPAPPDWPAGS